MAECYLSSNKLTGRLLIAHICEFVDEHPIGSNLLRFAGTAEFKTFMKAQVPKCDVYV